MTARSRRGPIHDLVAVSGPETERTGGVLALTGIQSVLDGKFGTRLSAERAEKALARVEGAVDGDPAMFDMPVLEGL
jgi:hypothetical protein